MKKKVLFVCLGNICRSPMAEAIFKKKIQERGIEKDFIVDSCGTGNWHIGEQPDRRTIENARRNNVPIDHRARQLAPNDLEEFDHIFVMDSENRRNTLRLASDGQEVKVKLMRDFDPQQPGADVPDHYFGGEGGFQEVFNILDRSIDHWLENHN